MSKGQVGQLAGRAPGRPVRALKRAVRRLLPGPALDVLLAVRAKVLTARARRAFASAPAEPAYLGRAQLERLFEEHPPLDDRALDGKSRERRGRRRARQLARAARGRRGRRIRDCLELGCGDATTSLALRRAGKAATAVDLRPSGADERAAREGVRVLGMDAGALRLPDESFDLVFSFDAFEHFRDPEAVMRESVRVARKGGWVFIEAGPLYASPGGLHVRRRFGVPYAQHLFPREVLDEFMKEKGVAAVPYEQLNGWGLSRYGALWERFSDRLEMKRYREGHDLTALGLVRRFPSCFRGKTERFEELIADRIEVLFRKRS